MATTKKRINITLSPHAEEALKMLAKENKVPQATKASELIEEALELYEDIVLVKIMEKRIKGAGKKKPKYLSHEEVWKKFSLK